MEAKDTRAVLPGARLTIVGTAFAAVTDQSGEFRFARLPVGTHLLRVTYLGRAPQSREIRVTDGTITQADFVLEAASLTTVTVRAAGQAEALSRQRNAPNIKSVVASDQMGRFPDASAPEALQRLPGVAVQRDQGEGRYVQIRGASAATTQITVNGEQIGSPEADSRQIALDAIPVGVLAAIEVSKAITPDMDADAIGGSVNLVTKRAGQGRTFTLEGSGGYAPIRSAGSGLTAATYGDRTSNGKLGWLFSGSFGERNFGSDGVEPDYDGSDLAELDQRDYTLRRRRTGATAAIDFKASDRSTFYVTSLWSELEDQEQRRRILNAVEDGELQYLHKNRLEKIGTFNVLAGGEHRMGRGIGIDYRFGLTRSQEDTPFDRELVFLQEDVTFAPSRADVNRPQANPQAGTLGGTYLFDEFTTGSTLTQNRDLVGAFNVSIPLGRGAGWSGTFRSGVKFRDKRKDQRIDAFETGPGGGPDITLGSDLGRRSDDTDFAAGPYQLPWRTTDGEVFSFGSQFAGRLDPAEQDVEAQTEAFDLRERVAATYAMAELNFGSRLLVLPGVRFEATTLETDGNQFDADAETLTPLTAKNDYTNLFPMLHARYRVNDATNVKAAFTSTIFRPNFFDLVPYRIVDGDDLETGNPQLSPTTANNFDLTVERFAQNVGLLSAGVFHKRLTNPIFSQTVDNAQGGETTQPVNAVRGEITGLELAWQQRLTFLPGLLNGLGLYTNYTWTDSEARQPNGRVTRLAGQAEQSWNVALSYEKRGFSGQVSVNTIGRYIDELGEDADGDLFSDRRTQVDLSASLFITRTAQIFVDALNLTNAPLRTYQAAPDFLRQREFYRPSVQVGFRFRP